MSFLKMSFKLGWNNERKHSKKKIEKQNENVKRSLNNANELKKQRENKEKSISLKD